MGLRRVVYGYFKPKRLWGIGNDLCTNGILDNF